MSPSGAQDKKTVREYREYGAMVGGALGTIVAIIAMGPNLAIWAFATDLRVFFCCTVGGIVMGYLAASLIHQMTCIAKQDLPDGNSDFGPSRQSHSDDYLDGTDISSAGLDSTGTSDWHGDNY